MVDHFDGIVGGVGVCNISYTDLAAFTSYHGDTGIVDLMALTNGRAYSMQMQHTPSPWERGYYSAALALTQVGRM
jgi:hypothetical protein